jgi:hypothetical protein
MSLSDIGLPGQQIDVLNGGDVDPSGRLLSVAEIQQAFRELRRRCDQTSTPTDTQPAPVASPSSSPPATERTTVVDGAPQPHTAASPQNLGPHTSTAAAAEPPHTPAETRRDAQEPQPHTAPKPAEATHGGARLGQDWIAVVSAHSGAGASCVALAITDALSAAERPARLIEAAHPARSGLVAAAAAELGTDPTGAWRRGSRRLATLYRRAGDIIPDGWPEQGPGDPASTVVDLGLPAPANLAQLSADQPSVVLVCRVTVPGVRLADHLLAHLHGAAVVLAAVGAGRWPGEVVASLGPHVRALRESGQVVTVPEDRRLLVTGPTNSPLPKSVAAAGRALLGLIDTARPGGVTTTAQGAPRRKGATR